MYANSPAGPTLGSATLATLRWQSVVLHRTYFVLLPVTSRTQVDPLFSGVPAIPYPRLPTISLRNASKPPVSIAERMSRISR